MKKELTFIKKAFRHWYANNPGRMGAALSYYMLFSLPAIITLLVLFAGAFFGHDNVQATLLGDLGTHVGSVNDSFVGDIVRNSNGPQGNALRAVLSFLIILLGASGIFSELRTSLGNLWGLPKEKFPPRTLGQKITTWLRGNLPNLLLLAILGLLFIISILGGLFLGIIGDYIHTLFPYLTDLTKISASIFSLGLITVFFALLYKVIAKHHMSTKSIFFGACITSVLFIFGEYIIGIYLKSFADASVYGAARSLVGLLIWVYYSAQVFYLGASFTYALSHKSEYFKN